MKQKILVRGPCLTQSGYGEHTRMILRALKTRQDIYDIYIVPVGWGMTGWQHEISEEREWLDQVINKTQQYIATKGPFDISIQVSIPNEWQKLAPINIGVTAGIETTKVSFEWIQAANSMDKIIVTSEHAKQVFLNTRYEAIQEPTGNTVEVKVVTPIEVVGYPAVLKNPKVDLNLKLHNDFNYIFVGQWGPRKNVDNMLKWWLEENWSEPVGLVLKVSHAKNNLFDKNHTIKRINHICSTIDLGEDERECKLYLIHGDMSQNEINSLYFHPKIKCMISTSHGEGFGLPLFDFAQTGKPVIATGWSGHLDFLSVPPSKGKKKKTNPHLMVSYDLSPVQQNAVWDGVIVKDSMWAFPHAGSFKHRIKQVRKNKKWFDRAEEHASYIKTEFSEGLIYDKFCNSLRLENQGQDSFEDEYEIIL
jgi:glycosyltransferase involved in cell wall biosynthesis